MGQFAKFRGKVIQILRFAATCCYFVNFEWRTSNSSIFVTWQITWHTGAWAWPITQPGVLASGRCVDNDSQSGVVSFFLTVWKVWVSVWASCTWLNKRPAVDTPRHPHRQLRSE